MSDRNPKFRMWAGKMLGPATLKDMIEGARQAPEEPPNATASMEFQQHTGLEDAEGTPVYEGDIIAHESMEMPFVVRWWDRGAAFRAFDPQAPDGTASYPLAACLSESGGPQMTVVGNVHEAPDLIDA